MATQDILNKIATTPDIQYGEPEIAAFVATLLDYAKSVIVAKCSLPAWPELSRGFSKSGLSPAASLDYEIGDKTLIVSVNGCEGVLVTLIMSPGGYPTGSAIAMALQACIRLSLDVDDESYYEFSTVNVSYVNALAGGEYYLLESAKYGPCSRIEISYDTADQYLCHMLKLGKDYGGEEVPGTFLDRPLEDAAALLVMNAYRKTRLIPEIYERGTDYITNRAFKVIDDEVNAILLNRRKMSF